MLVRRLAFLLIALAVSAGTVVLARSWLHTQLASRKPAAAVAVAQARPSKMVLVAKTNLPTGQFVRADNLRWQAWPQDGVAASYVVEGKGKLEDYVGAVVRNSIMAGEPITEGRLVRPGDRGFMAAVLTPGYRAVTVPVTPSSGIAGFAFPGDHVDVILTMTIEPQVAKGGVRTGVERRGSETILRNIRVLALDQRADDLKHEVAVAKTATLEVTPKQAEIIAVATEMGKLSLSLRSLAQDTLVSAETRPYTWDTDAASLLRARGGLAAGRKVSVVRGSKSTDVEFATAAIR